MKGRVLTWEDALLVVAAALWLATGARMAFFHYFVLVVMAAVLVLGLRRGLLPAIVRTAAVSGLVAVAGLRHGLTTGALAADLASVSGCGLLAGFLGDGQRRAREALAENFRRTLEALSRALEARDPYTEGHSQRTARYADAIAEALGLGREVRNRLRWAALLHDLGKIGVPDALLHKNGGLSEEERRRMADHPAIGAGIIEGLPFLREAAALVLHHHDRFDGAGKPGGLAGDAIPLEARVLTVADALDALTTDRPYRKATGWEESLRELEKESGTRFDPAVLSAIRRLPPKRAVENPRERLRMETR
jgi:putative nucleotidyltransferase with HDIG domain